MTDQTPPTHELGSHPDWAPPTSTVGAVGWVRANLISSPLNILLTVFGLWLIYQTIPPIISWAFIDAIWSGDSAKSCRNEQGGPLPVACWIFIEQWFKFMMYGRYPDAELWRINSAYVLLVGSMVPLFIPGFKYKGWIAVFLLFIYPIIAFYLFVGGSFDLVPVETPLWGGLFLTLVIAVTGIVASLPIGIILALGRRSKMPIVRAICVAFIEFWRGVPLITVLLMSSVMFPLFLPEGMNFDKLIRALVGVALFSAAYMAEVVRGGLQAIPKGQMEAAEALGLSFWKTMGLIILPQALKMVIPGIVNTFIGLFKDTTLVLIIGLFDFLGAIQATFTNPEWGGFHTTGYVFSAFIFWCFCFSMSRYSQHLEKKLHTGH
ncbi:MAG: amino acid ABC transporter permease [Rhodospirillaceae bacterium]|nr:amino acid ABC transporter permease [Rhodospirillaceae bacterium]